MTGAMPVFEATFSRAPDGGQRLWVYHAPPPNTPTRGAMLFVHPLAEEMNKCRRMVAETARALAADGWAVLLIDLKGCGDSSGELADARWQDWLDDITRGARWLGERHRGVELWLWGLRAGCLLCVQALPRIDRHCHLLMWQVPASGKALLQQFLRLKLAGSLQDGNAKAVMDDLKAARARGETVEVAGYRVNADIAAGIEGSTMAPPAGVIPGRLICLEVSALADGAVSPAAERLVSVWSAAGFDVHRQAVTGPSFWQTSEIELAPALTAATREALLDQVLAP